MTTSVIEHLRRAVLLHNGAELSDGDLLGRFIGSGDEPALATLIHRHGPMVWGVCRRLLSHHDSEDAFQATFLVLVRKAASILPREMVGNWLFGVAQKTALQARRTATRRKTREMQVAEMPEHSAPQRDRWSEVQPLLDQELLHLPEIYRAVIVLCDLEGRTRRAVALQLGCPEGTVAGRLARARAMLAKRLAQRGVALSSGALVAVLSGSVGSAGMPISVVSNTIDQATGVISPHVAALTEGVLKAMLMTKFKALTAIVLVLGLAVTGATRFVYHNTLAQEAKPDVGEKPAPTALKGEKLEPTLESKLKWGEPVNGLRAAIAIRLPPGKAKEGDKPDLYLAVQNVSEDPIRLCDTEVPQKVDARRLLLKKDGRILYGLGAREPGWGDRVLRSREVAFLPIFDTDKKLKVPANSSLDGHTIGSEHADQILKDSRHTLVAELNIEKAPAKAWTGKLVTGETGGAAAEIKAEPAPALEKKLDPEKEAFPTQSEMRFAETVKSFLVAMRTHHADKNANALRKFIDPRYLEKHGLKDKDLSVAMPNVGAIYHCVTADDGETVVCIVDTESDLKQKVREAIVLRVIVHKEKHYIAPLKAPDSKTGAFTPWILRTKTDYK